MGRRKVQIRRIQDDRARKVTFAKRKHGLVKKAMELSLLCDCDIALLIFTKEKPDQRFFQYTTGSMRSIMDKLAKNPIPVEDRHNGQYDQLYVKKGKGGGEECLGENDGDGDENILLPNQMPAVKFRDLNQKSSPNKRRKLRVEIPAKDTNNGTDLAQLGDGDLNTPNSIALFNQLGTEMMGSSDLKMSPNLDLLDALGEGCEGEEVNEPSPNTLVAFMACDDVE